MIILLPEMQGVRTPSPITIEVPSIVAISIKKTLQIYYFLALI